MTQGGTGQFKPAKSDTAKQRALKAFVLAVVALVLFNLVLFANFVIGAKHQVANRPPPSSSTNAATTKPAQP